MRSLQPKSKLSESEPYHFANRQSDPTVKSRCLAAVS
jgi:hypothetical protein